MALDQTRLSSLSVSDARTVAALNASFLPTVFPSASRTAYRPIDHYFAFLRNAKVVKLSYSDYTRVPLRSYQRCVLYCTSWIFQVSYFLRQGANKKKKSTPFFTKQYEDYNVRL